MTDWWTYRPSDFLMFAPRAYYRLFELANAELWPAHGLVLAAGVAIILLWLAAPRWPHAVLLACVLLALVWWWVGWAFLWERYAPINWAASGFAMAFALQGVLLLLCAAMGAGPRRVAGPAWARRTGLALWLFALLLHPAVGPLLGRPWLQAEWFGIAPDPTVLATLGLLLRVAPAVRTAPSCRARALAVALWCVPLLWCAVSGATLWAMGSPDAWLMPAAAVLALVAARRAHANARSSRAPV